VEYSIKKALILDYTVLTIDARQSPTLARPAAPLAACVQRISSVDNTDKNWLSWQRPLSDRKTNFKLVIHMHSSISHQNLAKIGPVHFEIIDLTGIVQNKKQKPNISSRAKKLGHLDDLASNTDFILCVFYLEFLRLILTLYLAAIGDPWGQRCGRSPTFLRRPEKYF